MKITLTKPAHLVYPLMSTIQPGQMAQLMNGAYQGSIGVCFRHLKDGPIFLLLGDSEYWSDLESKTSLQIRILQPGETLTVGE